jgi:uncharacterized protein
MLLVLMFIGASLASFIGFAIAQFVLGIPLLDDPSLLDDRSDPSLTPVLRVLQTLQAMGMLVLPGIFILYGMERPEGFKRLFRSPKRQAVMLTLIIFPILIPFVHFTAELNAAFPFPGTLGDWAAAKEAEVAQLTMRFMDMPTAWMLLFNLFMIAVLPALGEELLFRGIVQRMFIRYGFDTHLSVWCAAILFSAIHLQFLSFLPRVLMGVVLGYLLVWSGNIWFPIIAHFANNAAAVALHYASQHGLTNVDINDMGGGDPVMVMFSFAFGLMLLYLFRQYVASPQAEPPPE